MRLASRIRTFLFSMRRRLIASPPERLAEQGIPRQLRWPLMLRLTLRRFSCLWKAMRARISRWKMNLRSRLYRIHSRRKRFRLRRRLRWPCMVLRLGLRLLMLLRLLRGFILCCGTAFSDCAPCGKFSKGSRKTAPYTLKGRAPGKAGGIYPLWRLAGGDLRLSPTTVRLRLDSLSGNRRSAGCPGPALSGPASSRP